MLMPEACLDSWQPYGCEWSISYLWHSMGWVRRADLIVLALMLAYVVVVFVRVSYHCRSARRAGEIDADGRDLRRLAADLSIQVVNLKSIATVAPYLGLVGTSIGIMDALGGVMMEKHAALLMITSRLSAAPIIAAVGILVAASATCIYNHLRTRLDSFEREIPDESSAESSRRFRTVRRFPLARSISSVPTFALIAAPWLAMSVAGYTIFASFRVPQGFGVELAPARCELDGDDRLIVLRVSNAGEVFINSEKEDWTSLAGRLSQIYGGRKYRTLYLLAEEDVSFQTVADAIDIANSLSLNVRLITPAAMKATCLEPVAIRPARHGRK